jgi:hypothetical protein
VSALRGVKRRSNPPPDERSSARKARSTSRRAIGIDPLRTFLAADTTPGFGRKRNGRFPGYDDANRTLTSGKCFGSREP